MTNTNCLEGITCPSCGSDDQFRIRATTLALVTDDGVEDHGDMEWDDDSYAECTHCITSGKLRDFQRNPEPGEPGLTMTNTDHLFTAIARKHLFIETLDERKLDRLDFHEVAVWGVAAALQAAYDAGAASAHPEVLSLLRDISLAMHEGGMRKPKAWLERIDRTIAQATPQTGERRPL